jgi:hypothetical protein
VTVKLVTLAAAAPTVCPYTGTSFASCRKPKLKLKLAAVPVPSDAAKRRSVCAFHARPWIRPILCSILPWIVGTVTKPTTGTTSAAAAASA